MPVFLKKGPDRAQKAHRPGPAAPNKNCGVPRIFRRPTWKGKPRFRSPSRGKAAGKGAVWARGASRGLGPGGNGRAEGCLPSSQCSGTIRTAAAVPQRKAEESGLPDSGIRRASHRARAAEAGRGALGPGGLHTARAAEAGRRSRAHFHEAAPRPHPFRRFSAAGPLGRPGTAVFKPSGKGVGTVLKEKGRSRTKPNGARPTPPRPQGAARQGCGRGVSPRRAVGEGRGASGPHFFIAERQRQGGAFK